MAETNLSSKGVALALLAIFGTVVLYLFGFTRGLEMVQEGAQERANNQAAIDAMQKKLRDLQNVEQEFALAQGQVNALTVAMPADKQVAEVLTMLETIAARAGLILENVQPGAPTLDGLPVTVAVRGGFGQTLTFVELLEKNVRPFRMGPVTIAAGDADLASTFDVVVLYQVPPEDLPQEAVPTTEDTGL